MADQKPHQECEDLQTATQIREAQVLQRAFGDDAAKSYLNMHQVDEDATRRVLEHEGQRRQY
jgi:hypothetical protein